MSEIRKRKEGVEEKPFESAESDHVSNLFIIFPFYQNKSFNIHDFCVIFKIDSEDDKAEFKAEADLSKAIPTGTDKIPGLLDKYLPDLPTRWRNWVVRGIFSIIMITFFCLVIYGGPLALMITVCITFCGLLLLL